MNEPPRRPRRTIATLATLAVFTLQLAAGLAAAKTAGRPIDKALLFSSDGMRPDLMQKYANAGEMPTYTLFAGFAFMASLGLPGLIASAPADYVQRAIVAATDLERLAEWRRGFGKRYSGQNPGVGQKADQEDVFVRHRVDPNTLGKHALAGLESEAGVKALGGKPPAESARHSHASSGAS